MPRVLRALREQAGLTKSEVARRLGSTWHTPGWHEEGKHDVYLENLSKYAEIYETTVDHLLKLARVDKEAGGPDPSEDVANAAEWTPARRAVEDFLADPSLSAQCEPWMADVLRTSFNMNALYPTKYTVFDIVRTTPWDLVKAQLVDGKMPSARGAKIPGRKGGNKPGR